MGWRQGSVAADHTLLTAGGGGFLSAEVFTSLLLMAEDFPGEPGAVKEADNHPIFPPHYFFLTVKFNSWPDRHLSNSLCLGTRRWKPFLFLSDGQKDKK